MPIRIAIVDDHPLLIKGLQAMLKFSEDINIIATYPSGQALLVGLKHEQPDVLLLDIQMPGQMGDRIAEILQESYPRMMILALTNMEHEFYIHAMIKLGVMGYVLKSSDEAVLLEAIRTVSKGVHFYDPSIRKHAVKLQHNRLNSPRLTKREQEILELIAADYNSQDIANKLFLSKRTVDNHRINLLLKLDVKGSASLVKKAIDLGLIK